MDLTCFLYLKIHVKHLAFPENFLNKTAIKGFVLSHVLRPLSHNGATM